jgi:hypothetical protein
VCNAQLFNKYAEATPLRLAAMNGRAAALRALLHAH